jgi:hypothetical protein
MTISLIPHLKKACFMTLIVLIISCSKVHGQNRRTIQNKDLIVSYTESLRHAAHDVVKLHPKLKHDLEKELLWPFREITAVLLLENSLAFHRMVGNKLIVAIAIPQKNLIVIDYSRANAHPFSFESIIKHEMCHLLLHQHIKDSNLPKWLDEGICQLLSDGVAEIMVEQSSALLDSAILGKRLMSIRRLDRHFPREDQLLQLAYAQSKSLVAYTNNRFGRSGIIGILEQLERGHDVDTAVHQSLSISLKELEEQWRNNLKRKTNWFSYLAKNLYVLLFFLGALITIAAALRLIIKKRRYMNESD